MTDFGKDMLYMPRTEFTKWPVEEDKEAIIDEMFMMNTVCSCISGKVVLL